MEDNLRNNSNEEKIDKNNEKKWRDSTTDNCIPQQKTRIDRIDIRNTTIIEIFSELKKYHSSKISSFPEYEQKYIFKIKMLIATYILTNILFEFFNNS